MHITPGHGYPQTIESGSDQTVRKLSPNLLHIYYTYYFNKIYADYQVYSVLLDADPLSAKEQQRRTLVSKPVGR